jgi:hypothetical protein
MKKCMILLVLLFSLLMSMPVLAGGRVVEVDILYMNHGPMKPTIDNLKELFSRYGDNINPRWHDFETQEGEKFMTTKGIHQHVPLMIWVNGKNTVQIEGSPCSFSGFPSGSGPEFFQGKWTLDSLAKALDAATQQK